MLKQLRDILTPPSPASGSSAHVFEVTDLLIPAGTDWSVEPYVLGTFELPLVGGIFYALDVEVATGPSSDEVLLNFYQPGLSSITEGFDAAAASPDGSAAGSSHEAAATTPSDALVNPGEDPILMTVALHTAGPTADDITIVRARAAFLVI